MQYKKICKTKQKYNKHKKEKRSYDYFSGGYTSNLNKNSSLIQILIDKRMRKEEYGMSFHIASFVPKFSKKSKFSNWSLGKIAIGENSERSRYGNDRMSTHAEMNALKKLDNLFRIQKKKKEKMDLIVIRINKSGNLCESAPCFHCTQELMATTIVSIKKLYFSRWDGTITCVDFSEYCESSNLHISKGWKCMHSDINI
jgi:hypothetical protein